MYIYIYINTHMRQAQKEQKLLRFYQDCTCQQIPISLVVAMAGLHTGDPASGVHVHRHGQWGSLPWAVARG